MKPKFCPFCLWSLFPMLFLYLLFDIIYMGCIGGCSVWALISKEVRGVISYLSFNKLVHNLPCLCTCKEVVAALDKPRSR